MTKRLDYRNKFVAWPNNKANFLKKPFFLNKIVIEALDRNNIATGNKTDVKQIRNSKKIAIVKSSRLVIKYKIITEVLNRMNIREICIIKEINFKGKIIARV